MSVTNNGKQKRNKKKKRLIKLLIIVIILFILLMLAGTLLLQHRKNVDREQRKAEAIAALERVPTVTGNCRESKREEGRSQSTSFHY